YFWWQNFSTYPYECIMLFRTNFIGRSWSPFLLELNAKVDECSIENYNSKLQFTKDKLIFLIENTNSGFKFFAPAGEIYSENYLARLIEGKDLDSNGCLLIDQNDIGIDLEDRIEKCAN